MKKQFITGPSVPTAQLCINKSRLKIHNKETDPTYYLQSGQEFQMEFHNPTSDTILAKIYLNGKAISQGGLVLRPAERVFLNRYLDVAKKFLFETYEVANTKEAQKAIEYNGDFKVEFFREYTPLPYYGGYSTLTITPDYNWSQQRFFTNTCNSTSNILRGGVINTGSGNSGLVVGSSSLAQSSMGTNVSGTNVSGTNVSGTNVSGTNAMYNESASLGLASMDSMSLSDSYKSTPRLRSLKAKKSIETGRVEAGDYSDQKIKTVNKTFDHWAFHTVEYKLLPISQKVNTSSDINVSRYCSNCGGKIGKTDKFCSKCGTRI